jgi:hypothetical protein
MQFAGLSDPGKEHSAKKLEKLHGVRPGRGKGRNNTTYQVFPSRTKENVRAYDSAASGVKGTAVYVPDQYGSHISDKGISRGVATLPSVPLSTKPAEGHFVVNITNNGAPTVFNSVADSAHSLHLQDLWVCGWQVTADLQDPDTAALPAGPLVLEVKGDTIHTYSHVFSNIGGLGSRVYLPWNLNGAEAYTSMNDHSEPILIYRWKHGDGTLKNVSVQLRAPSAAATPLTFTNAFVTFAYTVGSWSK